MLSIRDRSEKRKEVVPRAGKVTRLLYHSDDVLHTAFPQIDSLSRVCGAFKILSFFFINCYYCYYYFYFFTLILSSFVGLFPCNQPIGLQMRIISFLERYKWREKKNILLILFFVYRTKSGSLYFNPRMACLDKYVWRICRHYMPTGEENQGQKFRTEIYIVEHSAS